MIWLDTSGYPCSWWTYGASAHRGHRQCPHLPFCGSACVFLELLDSIGRADPQARRNGFYWDIASGVSAAGHCEESQGRSQESDNMRSKKVCSFWCLWRWENLFCSEEKRCLGSLCTQWLSVRWEPCLLFRNKNNVVQAAVWGQLFRVHFQKDS